MCLQEPVNFRLRKVLQSNYFMKLAPKKLLFSCYATSAESLIVSGTNSVQFCSFSLQRLLLRAIQYCSCIDDKLNVVNIIIGEISAEMIVL